MAMEQRDGGAPEYGRVVIRLISRLERQRRRYVNGALDGSGLQGPMFMYLMTLSRHPGSSQDFLAEHFDVDKSNVARIARRLEDRDYITRTPLPEDRRQYALYLTEKGEALLPDIRRLLSEWSAIVTDGMNDDERQQAVSLLQRMMDNAAAARKKGA